jgi:hypothetical protein
LASSTKNVGAAADPAPAAPQSNEVSEFNIPRLTVLFSRLFSEQGGLGGGIELRYKPIQLWLLPQTEPTKMSFSYSTTASLK